MKETIFYGRSAKTGKLLSFNVDSYRGSCSPLPKEPRVTVRLLVLVMIFAVSACLLFKREVKEARKKELQAAFEKLEMARGWK